jgi:membrane associated rhomboid family serine protease
VIPIIPLDLNIFQPKYATVTKSICVINILIFLVTQDPVFMQEFALRWDSGFLTHRLITHQFVHAGFWHLFGNMIFFLPFGAVLEEKLGAKKMLFFYLVGGMVAGTVTGLLAEGPYSLVGASGAVSAVMGACLVLRPQLQISGIILIFLFQTRTWVWTLFFFIKDAVYYLAPVAADGAKVAYEAHLAGFACNFLLCVLALKLGFIRSSSSDLLGTFGMRVKARERSDEEKLKSEVGFRDLTTVDHVIEKLESEEESAFDINKLLILSKKSKLDGDARDAYKILQSWLEKNNEHERGAEVAYEIALIALRQLDKKDLARDWLADALRRQPREDLRENIETMQKVLDE